MLHILVSLKLGLGRAKILQPPWMVMAETILISEAKVSIPEWIFLIINILTELLSAAFDQLSSVNKHRYAFIAMLMSLAAAVTCIIELAYKAGKESGKASCPGSCPGFIIHLQIKGVLKPKPEIIQRD
ncbi:hypothetical protein V6N13_059713 [Hibiscus sabdariffa]